MLKFIKIGRFYLIIYIDTGLELKKEISPLNSNNLNTLKLIDVDGYFEQDA